MFGQLFTTLLLEDCPFVNTTIERVNPFVCVPDVVASLKEVLRYFTKRGTKDFTLES